MYPLYALLSMLSSGLHWIFGLWPLLYYSRLHLALPLVIYSTSLLPLSYYTMSILWLISFVISLLAPVCLCSWHGFECMLWFGFFGTRVLDLAHHLALASPLAGEFWLPRILISRSQNLKLVDSPTLMLIRYAQLKRGSTADRLKPYPSRLPCLTLKFSYCNSWVPFVLFTLVHLFVCSHLRLSMM